MCAELRFTYLRPDFIGVDGGGEEVIDFRQVPVDEEVISANAPLPQTQAAPCR